MYKPPRCEECEYWREKKPAARSVSTVRRGECKASGPDLGPNGYGFWPLTIHNDFCYEGKHEESELLTEGEKQDMEAPPKPPGPLNETSS